MDKGKEQSFSNSRAHKNTSQNKIELLTCQSGGKSCESHLSQINQKYSLAQDYLVEKDYLNSIKALKDAYDIATELRQSSCLKCVEFFRSTITQSLENINKELQMLTSGFLKNKRYELSYLESCNVLKEIKKCC